MTLARARCTNHELRQASGVCPLCRRPFCKECLTEHDGRLTCASCLKRAASVVGARGAWKKRLTATAMLAAALLGSWFFFYAAGSWLEMTSAPPAAATKVLK